MFYRLGNAAVWKTVLGSLGCNVPVRFATGMWIQSETCRWIPGSVWSMGSRVFLGAQYGLSKTVVSAGIALELAATVASWGVLVLGGIVLYGKSIVALPGGRQIADEITLAVIALAGLALPFMLFSGKISRKVRGLLGQFQSLSQLQLRRRSIGIAFIDYVILGIANGVVCWIVVYATLGGTAVSVGAVDCRQRFGVAGRLLRDFFARRARRSRSDVRPSLLRLGSVRPRTPGGRRVAFSSDWF